MDIAKPSTKDLNINPYQAALTPKDLSAMRRRLAKRANQRLVRLEKASSKITGERYQDIGAAPIAYGYLKKTGRTRFTESRTPMDYEKERREVVQLQAFLSSKTSLVSGIRDIERKRIATFESGKWGSYADTGTERRPIKFSTTKEFYDFFQSSIFKELKSYGFSSEQLVESYDTAVETFKGSSEEAMDALSEALERFRQQGSISLKDLRSAARGQPLK